jgi:hypothetical protein
LAVALGLVVSLAACPGGGPAAAPTGPEVSIGQFPISQHSVTYSLEYCATAPITTPSTTIQRIVVVIQGGDRSACGAASSVGSAAQAAGVADTTLIVAPHFPTADAVQAGSGLLYWSDQGWSGGEDSLAAPDRRSWTISSFKAVDELLAALVDTRRFPNLSSVVVPGFSAGGQFVNRYAALARWRPKAGGPVTERFVIGSPSTYLYWDAARHSNGAFAPLTPAQVQACPNFNYYRYGLQYRTGYVGLFTDAQLKANYQTSQIRYLLGASDSNPADPSLDVNCGAEWQGSQRVERGQRYFDRLGAVFGAPIYDTQKLEVVPGVGHDGTGIYRSEQGRSALFGQ